MDASEFEGLLYNMFSEEPFANHRLDMTDLKKYIYNNLLCVSSFCHHNRRNIDMTYLSCHKSSKNIEGLRIYFTFGRNTKGREEMRKISHEKKTHLGKSCVTMKDFMDKFYETTELGDVICDNCTKSSIKTKKSNFEEKTVLKSPMQLRTSIQISHLNVENNIFCKNRIKIALPDQYSMSFPNDPKLFHILVFMQLHIGNDMDQGKYVCDVLYYYTRTWWNCDDEK